MAEPGENLLLLVEKAPDLLGLTGIGQVKGQLLDGPELARIAQIASEMNPTEPSAADLPP